LGVFLFADLVDFLYQGVSQGRPQSQDEVYNSLLEGVASGVDAVQSANLQDQLQSILPDFGVLVGYPLAREFSYLLVVLAYYQLVGLPAQFLCALNGGGSLDEESQSANDGLLLEGLVADDFRNDGGHLVFLLILAFGVLGGELAPDLVNELDTLLADSGIGVRGLEHNGPDQTG
jgi:hypothetical protein